MAGRDRSGSLLPPAGLSPQAGQAVAWIAVIHSVAGSVVDTTAICAVRVCKSGRIPQGDIDQGGPVRQSNLRAAFEDRAHQTRHRGARDDRNEREEDVGQRLADGFEDGGTVLDFDVAQRGG